MSLKTAKLEINVYDGDNKVLTRSIDIEGIEDAKQWAETCIYAIKYDDCYDDIDEL